MNEFNALIGQFNTKYGYKSTEIYNKLFKDINGAAPDMGIDANEINKVNALLKYTLNICVCVLASTRRRRSAAIS